jgi:hypothetical protein
MLTGLRLRTALIAAALAGLGALPAFAQQVVSTPEAEAPADAPAADTPAISVAAQFIENGLVHIDRVTSLTPGWVVIHIAQDGSPGPVAGYAPVGPGTTENVRVRIDPLLATPTLYAMLHTDDGEIGVYEFDGQSGLDNPVSVDGAIVTPAFGATVIAMSDQFPLDNAVTVDSVTTDTGGWLVIHTDGGGVPGQVIGQAAVSAGTTANVRVPITEGYGNFAVWPMLHVDTGTVGAYEFGAVEGADSPVIINGEVATVQVYTVPHMRVSPQIVLRGDATGGANLEFTVESALVAGPGWLVVHLDNGGAPGPVAGAAPLAQGVNRDVRVELAGDISLTPVLWPMLHDDTGTVGEYEFDGQNGLDLPVSVMDVVQTQPVSVAPSLSFVDQPILDGAITITSALIDGPGWLVIHADENGAPGRVLAQARLNAGLNEDIAFTFDGLEPNTRVFPMLHYDTGALGVYEFGTVEGADLPVTFNGSVVVAPLAIGE